MAARESRLGSISKLRTRQHAGPRVRIAAGGSKQVVLSLHVHQNWGLPSRTAYGCSSVMEFAKQMRWGFANLLSTPLTLATHSRNRRTLSGIQFNARVVSL